MSLPESMSRVTIVGSKNLLSDTVNSLFKSGNAHIIDFVNEDEEGFTIGAPLESNAKASERLLKIRSLVKELNVDEKTAETLVLSDVDAEISSGKIESIESEVITLIDEKNKLNQEIAALKASEENLKLLANLPLNLENYSGYSSLAVFVGTVKDGCDKALNGEPDIECEAHFDKKAKNVVAVFTRISNKDKIAELLSQYSYVEINVPEGTGSPSDNLSKVATEIKNKEDAIVEIEGKLKDYSDKYNTFLVASEEKLVDEVNKAETPLRIATTGFSFVIDAWVPTKEVADLEASLKKDLGEKVYFEIQEERGRKIDHETHIEKRFENPPSKPNNGPVSKRYEYPVELVSTPKYQETDPSFLMSIFLPLFFGFMVGDLGYAIPFIVLGAYGLKCAKSQEFQSIGAVLFYGGIWAALFGGLFFGEMLGMHFIGAGPPLENTHTWESLLGVTLPDWFSGVMIQGHGIHKIGTDHISMLLKLTVYVGIVHLFISYFVGVLNIKRQHNMKEAMLEKGGWIFSLVGMTMVCYCLTEILFKIMPSNSEMPQELLFLLIGGAVILIIGVALCFPKEGMQAILELPSIVGNILSYTRLAAIAMSKAGMALAFNYIALIMLAGSGDIIGYIFGGIIFVIGHLMIWFLAILSAGLHSLRLQFVESMNKFFEGNGVLYNPTRTEFKHIKKSKKVETEV